MTVRSYAVALTFLALGVASPAATPATARWQGIAVARPGFGITNVSDQPSAAAAEAALNRECANAGFNGCVILAVTDHCAAAAYSEQQGHYFSAGGATKTEARNAAYARCSREGQTCDNDMTVCP